MIRYLRSSAGSALRPALFLDRDGVLNRHIVDGYVVEPNDFEPIDVAVAAAEAAQRAGAALVVVTNQGVIGRTLATEADVMVIHALLMTTLSKQGIALDAIYACPHHPLSPDPSLRECECRKPKPGMIVAAARDLGLDLTRSALIGDQPSDGAAARAAGIADARILEIGSGDPLHFVRGVFGASSA